MERTLTETQPSALGEEKEPTSSPFPHRTIAQQLRDAGRSLCHTGLPYVFLMVLLVFGAWLLYERTTVPVRLDLDGHSLSFRTHQSTVAAFLKEIGADIHPKDVIIPSPETPVSAGISITLMRAQPYLLEVDGKLQLFHSHAVQVGDLLHEAGVIFGQHDLITLDREVVAPDFSLASYADSTQSLEYSPNPTIHVFTPRVLPRAEAARLALRRAVPLRIYDGILHGEFHSTATTIGEALQDQGILLYVGDQVTPDLGTRLTPGLRVYIKRSMPAEILVDGRTIQTRAQSGTVGELLTQEGIALLGKDRVEPPESTPLSEGISAHVVRVLEERLIEEEPIPYETRWQPNAELEIDQQQVRQTGGEGLTKRRVRIYYEDELEIARALEDEWIDRQPENRILEYGTKIVLREMDTPSGPITYWRRIRMLATSYTSATSGKTRDHPQYGITRLGWQMRAGIVAVDPNVINMRNEVYVPGYGPGVAGDTGGGIKGRRIDLGYEEGELVLWYRWVDIYLLAPPPTASQIRWVLPTYPQERR